MSNATIFDFALNIWDEQISYDAYDVQIKIGDNEKIFYAKKVVLKQLNFFENIFDNSCELEYTPNGETIVNIPILNNYFDTNTFSFLYVRLKNNYFFDKEIIPIIDDFRQQIKYITMIYYLTNPNERNELLNNIKWSDMFWIGLVVNKFQKLDTFFTKKDLTHGYNRCVVCLSRKKSLTDDELSELEIFFKIKNGNCSFLDKLNDTKLKIIITETGIFKEIIKKISYFISE